MCDISLAFFGYFSYRDGTLFTTRVLRFSKGKSSRAATAQSLA
jgi:hypothetical protein